MAREYLKITFPYGNTQWVRDTTRRNMVSIYKWIKKETKESDRKNPRFNVSQISEGTGIARRQVSVACFILALAISPKAYKGRLKCHATLSKFTGHGRNHLQEFSLKR